jgi:hypothetical protein
MRLSSLFPVPLPRYASGRRLHSGVRTHPCVLDHQLDSNLEGDAMLGVTFNMERSPPPTLGAFRSRQVLMMVLRFPAHRPVGRHLRWRFHYFC